MIDSLCLERGFERNDLCPLSRDAIDSCLQKDSLEKWLFVRINNDSQKSEAVTSKNNLMAVFFQSKTTDKNFFKFIVTDLVDP